MRFFSLPITLIITAFVLASPARAVVIDFQSLEHSGAGQQVVPGTGKFYTEKGFDFVSSAPLHNFATWGTASVNYSGSTALWNGDGTGVTGVTTLTRAGAVLSICSISMSAN